MLKYFVLEKYWRKRIRTPPPDWDWPEALLGFRGKKTGRKSFGEEQSPLPCFLAMLGGSQWHGMSTPRRPSQTCKIPISLESVWAAGRSWTWRGPIGGDSELLKDNLWAPGTKDPVALHLLPTHPSSWFGSRNCSLSLGWGWILEKRSGKFRR